MLPIPLQPGPASLANIYLICLLSHQIFALFLELPNIRDTAAVAGCLPDVFSLEVIFVLGGLKGKLILPLIRSLWDDHHGGLSDLIDKETNEKEDVSNFLSLPQLYIFLFKPHDRMHGFFNRYRIGRHLLT